MNKKVSNINIYNNITFSNSYGFYGYFRSTTIGASTQTYSLTTDPQHPSPPFIISSWKIIWSIMAWVESVVF